MIKDILTKYENFYKGGSGYTFQVEVDDFNELVKHIKWLEHLNNGLEYKLKTCKEDVCEMEKEIIEHCETKGLAGRQVFALTKRVDELTERIDKVTAECGVTWINEVLQGGDTARNRGG